MIALKLGGSVITEKDAVGTVDREALERAADAIGDYAGELILVHGGGSFGHPAAAEHEVSSEAGTRDGDAVRAVHDAMRRLNDAVLDALLAAGCDPVPVHPLSVAYRTHAGGLVLPTEPVSTILGEGFLPVLHGDVIAHAGSGVTVVSGDELVVTLAETFSVDRIGLCSTEPGVLDAEGGVIGEITDFESVAAAVGSSEATDVTGGMAAKVQTLLDVSVPASVFGLGDLEAFLDGRSVGTTVTGG